MENLLDHIFSSTWLITGIFIIALILSSIIVYATNFFKIKALNYIYKAVFLILPFLPIFLVDFLPDRYGFSYEVPVMCISGDKLCLLDKKEKGDETSTWEEYRLHILKADSGVRISRKFYDDITDIGKINGDTLLLYGYSKYIVVNIKTNEPIRIIDNEYLQKRFPELAVGIESKNYTYKNDFDNSHDLSISITSKAAKKYFYEPFSDKIITDEIVQKPSTLSYYFDSDRIFWKNAKNKNENIASLEYSQGSSKTKYLKFYNEPIEKNATSDKIDYIEPKFLEIFPSLKLFIMLSYETTDEINFVLHAFNFDGKEIWAVKQSDMNLTDRYTEVPKFNSAVHYKSNLIFNCGGFIVSMEASTGKINWRQRI